MLTSYVQGDLRLQPHTHTSVSSAIVCKSFIKLRSDPVDHIPVVARRRTLIMSFDLFVLFAPHRDLEVNTN